MLGGREGDHVDADLGDLHFVGALSDARDRHEQVTLAAERGDPLLNLDGEPVDRCVEEVDVREGLPTISAATTTYPGASRHARIQSGRQLTGGIRRAAEIRDRKMEQGCEGCKDPRRLTREKARIN